MSLFVFLERPSDIYGRHLEVLNIHIQFKTVIREKKGVVVTESLSSWLAEQEDPGLIPVLAT